MESSRFNERGLKQSYFNKQTGERNLRFLLDPNRVIVSNQNQQASSRSGGGRIASWEITVGWRPEVPTCVC